MREYFIRNYKLKSSVYLKLKTPIYCIPKNSDRPWKQIFFKDHKTLILSEDQDKTHK